MKRWAGPSVFGEGPHAGRRRAASALSLNGPWIMPHEKTEKRVALFLERARERRIVSLRMKLAVSFALSATLIAAVLTYALYS